jgi:octanoyl-[GcvH]:protein N-octanoyltransferase
MKLHLGSLGGDEGYELSVAHALLRRASEGEIDGALRIYRPQVPAVVFGRRDTLLPGFPDASAAALEQGFRPFVRPTGGRAVAYTQDAVVLDHIGREPSSSFGTEARFQEYGALIAGALDQLGIDARVGAVPGEYSVNARGVVKLVGTAQRSVRDAWLFSSLVVVGGSQRIRTALDAIYGHLGLPFDIGSVGAVSDEHPGLTVRDIERALLAAYDVDPSTAIDVEDETLERARALRPHHVVEAP